MSTLEFALQTLLPIEGEFSNNPADHGGATKYGISLSFYRTNIDPVATVQTINDLTILQVTEIYRKYFWDNYGYGKILNQQVATKLFLMCVNSGPKQAHKLIQRATWAVLGYLCVKDDGILGDESISAINQCASNIIYSFRSEAANFYKKLVDNDSSQAMFLNGWLKRAYK